jgi:hypothetical protein
LVVFEIVAQVLAQAVLDRDLPVYTFAWLGYRYTPPFPAFYWLK